MSAVIFAGAALRALKNALKLNADATIASGSVNPTSSAPGVSCRQGSIYLRTNGKVYKKITTDADDTNWLEMPALADALTTNGVVYANSDGNLDSETGFEYDAATNTLSVANLEVTGTTTTLNTATVQVEDNNITVNYGGNNTTAEGSGLEIDRTGTSGSLIYANAAATRFKIGDLGSEVEIADINTAQTLTNKSLDGDSNTITDLALTALKTNLTDASKFLVRDASGIVISNTKAVPTGDVVGNSDSQALTNKTIDADQNTLSNIENADIKAGAAIDFSKLAALASANILVGNGSNVATSVAMSGEATIANTGAVTLSNAAVIGKVLTGYTSGAGTVAATDTLLQAIQKLNGNDGAIADDVANLVTLSGVAVDSTHLGTFTGSTIADSSTVKAALQALETSLETKASRALDNLASVAINTSLISDTNNTDDLGSDAIEWKDAWVHNVKHNDASNPNLTIATTGNNGNVILSPHGTGVTDASSKKIQNVADPTAAQDAATKAYVDGISLSPGSFTGAESASGASVTGFAFANGTVRGFRALATVTIDATADLFETFDIIGIQKGASWEIAYTSVGDNTLVDFDINSSGQITYSSSTYAGFASMTIKFKGESLGV